MLLMRCCDCDKAIGCKNEHQTYNCGGANCRTNKILQICPLDKTDVVVSHGFCQKCFDKAIDRINARREKDISKPRGQD